MLESFAKSLSKRTIPLKWHGGKYYIAKEIISLMPRHINYVEPFAGGLSVLLQRDPLDSRFFVPGHTGVSEVINDLNSDLTNFWRVLQNHGEEFIRRVQFIPFSEAEWEQAREKVQITRDPVSWAVAFFVYCRQSLAGRMTSFSGITKTRLRRNMNNEVSAWLSTIEGLPYIVQRLRQVLIIGPRPAIGVITEFDNEHTLFYLDPPYLHETRATTLDYKHEMSKGQHIELLNTLIRIKGKFLLSGYSNELYDSYAKVNNWKRYDFEVPNNAAGGDQKRRMIESIYANCFNR